MIPDIDLLSLTALSEEFSFSLLSLAFCLLQRLSRLRSPEVSFSSPKSALSTPSTNFSDASRRLAAVEVQNLSVSREVDVVSSQIRTDGRSPLPSRAFGHDSASVAASEPELQGFVIFVGGYATGNSCLSALGRYEPIFSYRRLTVMSTLCLMPSPILGFFRCPPPARGHQLSGRLFGRDLVMRRWSIGITNSSVSTCHAAMTKMP
jgi:hypothetical protein